MNPQEKTTKIKKIVIDLLAESFNQSVKDVEKVLASGAVDVSEWDEKINPMILPKCIATAIMKKASENYEAKGTSFEKQVKREVKNIRYFI